MAVAILCCVWRYRHWESITLRHTFSARRFAPRTRLPLLGAADVQGLVDLIADDSDGLKAHGALEGCEVDAHEAARLGGGGVVDDVGGLRRERATSGG